MNNKPIVRTTYFNPITNLERQGPTSNGESRVDQEQYDAPMHQLEGALHDWGVAGGLTVTATIGSPNVTVAPGLALDVNGRHISLAAGGKAEVNPNAVPMVTSTLVDVSAVGVSFNTTTSGPGDLYLTIEWRETFDQEAFSNSQLFQMRHTPWLRLITAAQFSPDGARLALARLGLDAAGNVISLTQDQRSQAGLPVGTVKFWKAASSSAMPQQLTVSNQLVGEIGPLSATGLTLKADTITARTIAGADSFVMDVAGGSFGRTNGSATFNLFGSKVNDATGDNLILSNPSKVSVEASYVRVGSGFADLPMGGTNHIQMDVVDRVRIRQGGTTGAGLWLYQNAPASDRAMVGMAADGQVGFFGNSGAGWGLVMDTTTGFVGVGTPTPGMRLDVGDRMRVRQSGGNTAGIWFYQTAPNADRAFVGMASDTSVGFWGNTGAGWGLLMDTSTGRVGLGTASPGFRLDVADRIRLRASNSGSAGAWLFQANSDRAFVGLSGDTSVGLWGNTGAGWGLTMDTTSGAVTINSVGTDSTGLSVKGTSFGLCAHNTSSQNFAGLALPGAAGYFGGDVTVNGTLSKSAGTFLIDHPLDPANKVLRHAFVESPEMMNIYAGIATTGEDSEAVVELPSYFDALNKDLRYQLTPIGQLALAAVIEEVSNCRFRIKTDRPNVKVSWMVTGVRQDAYANAHPVIVEEEKKDIERGHYLHPRLYGQSISKHVWKAHVRSMGASVAGMDEEQE